MNINTVGLPVFPKILPPPQEPTYVAEEKVDITRTDYVEGYSDQEVNKTGRLISITISWVFTEEEYYYIFEPFFVHDINKGCRRFLFDIKESELLGRKETIARFSAEGGVGYRRSKVGARWWLVTSSLEYEYVEGITQEESKAYIKDLQTR